jgi:tetratricopeptide (TPR) repeat protein
MSRLEQLKQLAEVAPDDPISHYGVGLECINLERWEDAIAAFDLALGVDAKYSSAYYHKARAQISGGRSEAARATLQAGMAVAVAVGDAHTDGEMRELLESIR